jgi:hypothetical protein
MNEPSVPEPLREALIAALALVESVAEQQAYPDDSWKPEADRLRAIAAQRRAETPQASPGPGESCPHLQDCLREGCNQNPDGAPCDRADYPAEAAPQPSPSNRRTGQ